MNKNSKRILGLGVILSLFGLLFVFTNPQKLIGIRPDYSQEEEPVKIQGFEGKDYKPEDLPVKIVIPALSINLEIAKAKVVRGYWEVFSDKASWGEGSGIPGAVGNQVIFAHALEGLFLPLKDIDKEMEILVFTKEKWYLYKAVEIKEIFPNQTEVIAPTDDETLTLYTCSGFKDRKRLVVVAKRV